MEACGLQLRTQTNAKTRYAQIEKELLATACSCDKFSCYLQGLENFCIQTNHIHLVINCQELDKAPIRCQAY